MSSSLTVRQEETIVFKARRGDYPHSINMLEFRISFDAITRSCHYNKLPKLPYLWDCLQVIASHQIHPFVLPCLSRQITTIWLYCDFRRLKKKRFESTNLNKGSKFLFKSTFNYLELNFDNNQCTEIKETKSLENDFINLCPATRLDFP